MVNRVKSNRPRRARLRRIKLDEVSLVDRPANPHAKVTLFKRDAAKGYDDVYDAVCTTVVQDVKALDFDEVLAEERAREAGFRVNDAVWRKWQALQQSFRTIADDETVGAADKVTAMQESLLQFVSSLGEESEEIAETMTKAISADPVLAGLLDGDGFAEGDEPMTAAEKKQLEELQKKVTDLTKALEAATADDAAKKSADLQTELDEAKASLAEATEKLEKATADAEEAALKATMTDAEKEYMAGLADAEKGKFMRAKAADRKRMMQKSDEEDPVVYKSEATGEEFRKSDDPRLVRMAKQVDETKKQADEDREKRETAEVTKRAGEAPYSHFSADDADKIEVVRAIGKMDEGPRTVLEKMLEAGGKAISAAFESLGHNGGGNGASDVNKSAVNTFEGHVATIAKRDGISKSDAMSKARKEHPDAFAEAYPDREPDRDTAD